MPAPTAPYTWFEAHTHGKLIMNWMEIISVRMAGKVEAIKVLELCSKIRVPRVAEKSASLQVFGNSFSTDVSVHIHWKTGGEPAEKSAVGMELCRTLSDFGPVNHSLWVRQE